VRRKGQDLHQFYYRHCSHYNSIILQSEKLKSVGLNSSHQLGEIGAGFWIFDRYFWLLENVILCLCSLYMRFTILVLQVLNPAPSGNSVRSGRLQRVSSFGQVEGGELAASYLRSLVNSAASYPHSQ